MLWLILSIFLSAAWLIYYFVKGIRHNIKKDSAYFITLFIPCLLIVFCFFVLGALVTMLSGTNIQDNPSVYTKVSETSYSFSDESVFVTEITKYYHKIVVVDTQRTGKIYEYTLEDLPCSIIDPLGIEYIHLSIYEANKQNIFIFPFILGLDKLIPNLSFEQPRGN